jgi:superkiller protein 3
MENKGLDLLNKGKFDDALKVFDKILKKNSDNDVILTKKGFVLKEIGRYDEAIESLTKALTINPNFSEALGTLGNVYEKIGDYRNALGSYEKSIMIDPENAISWVYKGNILYTLGKIQEAVECFDTALKFNPNLKLALEKKEKVSRYLDKKKEASENIVKQMEKALSLKNEGKLEEALNCYEQTLPFLLDDNTIKYCNEQIRELKEKISIKNIELVAKNKILKEVDEIYKKAKEQISLNSYRYAITLLDKGLKLDPNIKELWSLKGIAFEKLHNYRIALENHNEALKLDPEDNTLLVHHGRVLMYLGRWDEVLDVADKILTINPNYQPAKNLRKNAIEQRSTYKEFEQKLVDSPDKGENWLRKGLFFKSLGFLEVALEFFEKSLEFNPNNEETLYAKGRLLLRRGETVESINLFEEVLKINPNFTEARTATAEAFILAGSYDLAESLLNNSNNYELWNRLGESYLNVKDYKEALNSFEKALSINSEFEPALRNKGIVLSKLQFKPEIYFPISHYNVDSIIPSDHDILYSTLCKTTISEIKGNKTISHTYTCHAIFTDYGLAINIPVDFFSAFLSSSKKAILKYYPWHNITLKRKGISTGFIIDKILGTKMRRPLFRLERTDRSETKHEFRERKGRFIETFYSLVIDKQNEMESIVYNLMMDKPELRKKKNFKNNLPGVVSTKIFNRALRKVKDK